MRALVAIFCALVLLGTATPRALADDWGQSVTGQHVYDRATVLSPTQIQTLEAKAATLDSLGAPTIVYIRVQSATLEEAQQQAADLMDAWDVESVPGAHDGFVMLVDLTPGDTRHGQVGMFSGGEHAHAQLPGSELNRIAGSQMRPILAQGDLAGGIGAGLDAAAADLQEPATGASVVSMPWLVALPFVLPPVVFVLIVAAIIAGRRGGSGRSRSGHSWMGTSTWSTGGGDSGGGASSGGDSGGTSF
jgi:uncharacterized protein